MMLTTVDSKMYVFLTVHELRLKIKKPLGFFPRLFVLHSRG